MVCRNLRSGSKLARAGLTNACTYRFAFYTSSYTLLLSLEICALPWLLQLHPPHRISSCVLHPLISIKLVSVLW